MKHGCSNSACTGKPTDGQCGGCSGCCGGGELTLCREEVRVLLELAQFAFLPIVQTMMNGIPQYAPTSDYQQVIPENFSEIILSLEQKHLVTIDPDIPLENAEYGVSGGCKDVGCGSLALTSQGQEVLDWLSPSEFSL